MLPNFFVIGAAKAGTTALHGYLGVHPEIHMSPVKEPNFFAPEDASPVGSRHSTTVVDRDAYERLFDSSAPLRGESSPAYSQHPRRPGVPERIAAEVPDARFVYLVRDPIERIVAFHLQRSSQYESGSLAEAVGDIDAPGNDYVCPSLYMTQIDRYRREYSDERILVVDQAALRSDRRATLRRVFGFLGVEPGFWASEFERETNPTVAKRGPSRVYRALATSATGAWMRRRLPGRARERVKLVAGRALRPALETPQVPADLEERLRERFAPEIEALREFSGLRFEEWSL